MALMQLLFVRLVRQGAAVLAVTIVMVAATSARAGELVRQPLVVSAAASLKDSFTEIRQSFEQQHGDIQILFNFASSSQLSNQIEQGAPVDVFAAADVSDVEHLFREGLTIEYRAFAENGVVVIVARDSGDRIADLGDLAKNGVRLVSAQKKVPIARYAREFLERADKSMRFGNDYRDAVLANIVSEESDVRTMVMKVALGEVDGAIVYETDLHTDIAGKLNIIAIPPDLKVTARYGIAMIKGGPNVKAARLFYDFVLSSQGAAILSGYGFKPLAGH
jgi:molybdate transport system substrate-binding protein